MRYTKLSPDAFKNLQLNAGIVLSNFNVEDGSFMDADILGATGDGVAFEAVPNYVDFGEGIDNCPANTKELKKLDYWEVTMSGTFKTLDADLAKRLVGPADVNAGKVTPRMDVSIDDFVDTWWVGDYSDENSDETGGFVAIHLMNSLSTGGFKLQSNNKDKGEFEFELTGHHSMANISVVPFEIYIKGGSGA